MAKDKCPICGEYKFEVFGGHRCSPSYQIVIIGNDVPPLAPFEIRMQLWSGRLFSGFGIDDAMEKAVADYQARRLEYCENMLAGAMLWESWLRWNDEHKDDFDALLDPTLLTWYDVELRMEPVYRVRKLRDGGGR